MPEIELLPDDSFDPYDDPRFVARRKLLIPAYALIVVGILSVFTAIFGSLLSGMVRENAIKQQISLDRNRDLPPAFAAVGKAVVKMNTDLLPLTNGLYAVCGALIAIGGYQMLTLSSRWMCVMAAILSLVPFASCCCCLGMVFGIWSLIVMNMNDVRTAFLIQSRASNRK